jgi:hypothetical protein
MSGGLNLVLPCLVMLEVWKGSDPANLRARRPSASPLVGLWWTAHLIMSIVPALAMIGFPATNMQAQITKVWIAIVGDLLVIPAAILGAMLVLGIGANQERRHKALRVPQSSAVPAAPAASPYDYSPPAPQPGEWAGPSREDDPTSSWLNHLG